MIQKAGELIHTTNKKRIYFRENILKLPHRIFFHHIHFSLTTYFISSMSFPSISGFNFSINENFFGANEEFGLPPVEARFFILRKGLSSMKSSLVIILSSPL